VVAVTPEVVAEAVVLQEAAVVPVVAVVRGEELRLWLSHIVTLVSSSLVERRICWSPRT
jgi:hypothetical protein